MTSLAAGVLLSLLAIVLLSLGLTEIQGQRRQQKTLQAYWNARAGVARYLETGQLPQVVGSQQQRIWSWETHNSCQVTEDPASGDLVFEGICQGVSRRLRCLQGDPARVLEEPGP